MYSFPNLEPVCWSMSSSNCWFLTHIQVSHDTGKVVWYSHLFKNSPPLVMIHTVQGFSIVNQAEVDVFLEFSCFPHDPMNVGNLIYGSSAFSKPSLYIWKFLVPILLKPSLKDFEHNLLVWSLHGSQLCYGEGACMSQWSYETFCSLATQDGWATVKSSDKMWSIGGGNGNPLQYSCQENLMNRGCTLPNKNLKSRYNWFQEAVDPTQESGKENSKDDFEKQT